MELKTQKLHIVDVEEGADRIGYKVSNVRRLIRKGLILAPRRLPGGRKLGWTNEEFEEMLRGLPVAEIAAKPRS